MATFSDLSSADEAILGLASQAEQYKPFLDKVEGLLKYETLLKINENQLKAVSAEVDNMPPGSERLKCREKISWLNKEREVLEIFRFVAETEKLKSHKPLVQEELNTKEIERQYLVAELDWIRFDRRLKELDPKNDIELGLDRDLDLTEHDIAGLKIEQDETGDDELIDIMSRKAEVDEAQVLELEDNAKRAIIRWYKKWEKPVDAVAEMEFSPTRLICEILQQTVESQVSDIKKYRRDARYIQRARGRAFLIAEAGTEFHNKEVEELTARADPVLQREQEEMIQELEAENERLKKELELEKDQHKGDVRFAENAARQEWEMMQPCYEFGKSILQRCAELDLPEQERDKGVVWYGGLQAVYGEAVADASRLLEQDDAEELRKFEDRYILSRDVVWKHKDDKELMDVLNWHRIIRRIYSPEEFERTKGLFRQYVDHLNEDDQVRRDMRLYENLKRLYVLVKEQGRLGV